MIKYFVTCLVVGVALSGWAVAGEDLLPERLAERLAVASPENGEKVFRNCKACHTIDMGGKNKVGPNLWGVVGRKVASTQGYGRYSNAMSAYGGVWSPERLDAFLEKPKAEIKGTRMRFPGLRKPDDRADLIAYLNLNSPEPLALTASNSGTEATPDADDADDAPDIGVLFAAAGAEVTYAYCNVCHSVRLVAQQGLDREGWTEMFEWMVEEQGMAEIEEPDFSAVLDYLTTNYNTDRPNFPKP